MSHAHQRALRVFVADGRVADGRESEWTELTAGEQPAVRFVAPDLKQAQRRRRQIIGDPAVSAILDITVVVDDDFRSAQRQLAEIGADQSDSLAYAGTLDGLASLIADVFVAGVADGVTLIPVLPQQDARALGEATLARVSERLQVAA